MKKENKWTTLVLVLVTLAIFVLLFIYSSMNLKNIDYGYQHQELLQLEKSLLEEINLLKAEKASLLNLKRVEDVVINRLGYQYPQPEQFIKVFEDSGETH